MKSISLLLSAALFLAYTPAWAEELACAFNWEGEAPSHPMLIEVNEKVATIRGGSLSFKFRVIENSPTELIIIEPHTKVSSGKDYPVGAALIVVDKQSKKLIRSNTFADPNFNKHGYGTCQPVG